MDSSTTTPWTCLFPTVRLLLLRFIEIPVINANSVDRSAASDLGLHCFIITLLNVSRIIWVNGSFNGQ